MTKIDFISLLIGGIYHEFGHAIAATALDCRLNSCGAFLTFVYPGAFVDVCHQDLSSLSDWNQLKVVCAGAWHNLVLSGIAYLLIYGENYAMTPFFKSPIDGATLVFVGEYTSPLATLTRAHDTVYAVDDCLVRSKADWRQCLSERMPRVVNDTIVQQPIPLGYCINQNELNRLPVISADENCCNDDNAQGLCFETKHANVHCSNSLQHYVLIIFFLFSPSFCLFQVLFE